MSPIIGGGINMKTKEELKQEYDEIQARDAYESEQRDYTNDDLEAMKQENEGNKIQIELNKIKAVLIALDRVLDLKEKLTSEEFKILEDFENELNEIKRGN